MVKFVALIILSTIFNMSFANENQKNIYIHEYNSTIFYSPKTIKREVKYKENVLLKENEIILKSHEVKNFRINFSRLLKADQYQDFEFLYKSSIPLTNSQKSAEYDIEFVKENNEIKTVKFTNSNLDLDLDLDLTKASYKPKDKIYLIKRMLGLDFNNAWQTTSIAKLDVVQRRFSKRVTYNDTIEIYTKKNIELHNIVLGVSKEKSNKVKEKFDLPIAFLTKVENEEYNIYTLDINEFLIHKFPSRDDIYLTELQILLEKFHVGDIQKIRFLHSLVDKKKDIKNYTTEQITDNIFRDNIELKKYQNYKIRSINIKIKNTQKNTLVLQNIQSSLFRKKQIDIPVLLDEYFPIEIKLLNFEDIKQIGLDKKVYGNENNLSIINALIKSNSILKKIPDEQVIYFSNKSLTVANILNQDVLFKINTTNVYANTTTSLFADNILNLQIDIKKDLHTLETNTSKYFNIYSMTLIPTFNISKVKFADIVVQNKDKTVDENNGNIWKILKLVIYIFILLILFTNRKFIYFALKSSILKIKSLIELLLNLSFKSTGVHAVLLYSVFYTLVSIILYVMFIISPGVNTNSLYITFSGISFVVVLSYFSLYLRPWVLTKYTAIGKKVYRKDGSLYFVWAVIFLALTSVFISIKLELVAEELAIIIYYLLVWGTIKELLAFKENSE